MRIPKNWVNLLKEVQDTFPDAVIAGGCLRDLILGKTIKDIDIFIPSEDEDLNKRFLEKYEIKKDEIIQSYGGFANKEVDTIASATHILDDYEVQFVCVKKTKADILPRFDFGICRIMYDRQDIIRTPEFNTDIANKTFTLMRCDNQDQYSRSMRRWEKFKSEKFSDYTLDKGVFGRKYGNLISW